MGCCGEKRQEFYNGRPGAPGGVSWPSPQATPRGGSRYSARFKYVGKSGLTVRGPVSRRIYRFDRPGAVVTVDARDGASLARVPNLRRTHLFRP
jgi:hypothetical protein